MKQFAVIGLGTFGRSVAAKLAENGVDVLAIDSNEKKIQEVSSIVTQAIVADSTDEKTLKEIGITDFETVIVAIGNNLESSILTTLLLKELGVSNIIVKGIDSNHAKVLQKIGVDKIIFPEKEMGEKLASMLIAPNIIEKIELSQDYDMAEIIAPKSFIEKTIRDLDIRAKYKLHVIGIKRKVPFVKDDGDTDFKDDLIIAPSPTESLQDGDILVAIGKYVDIERVKNI
ncbi:MAG: Ktr system potassium uptake protein A [Elusimicrobia bacterium ADurb.Bin231]|nr:MAG: Ktr system potassium uptake protein A [Elusimicrobia bacterium ADurb.Bin231]